MRKPKLTFKTRAVAILMFDLDSFPLFVADPFTSYALISTTYALHIELEK